MILDNKNRYEHTLKIILIFVQCSGDVILLSIIFGKSLIFKNIL